MVQSWQPSVPYTIISILLKFTDRRTYPVLVDVLALSATLGTHLEQLCVAPVAWYPLGGAAITVYSDLGILPLAVGAHILANLGVVGWHSEALRAEGVDGVDDVGVLLDAFVLVRASECDTGQQAEHESGNWELHSCGW